MPQTHGFQRRYALLVVVAGATVAALALSVHTPSVGAQSSTTNPLGRLLGSATQADTNTIIRVRGTGSVPVKPDRAVVVLGVETQQPQAASALSANSDATSKLVAALVKADVPASAIQTGTFSIQPVETPRNGPEGSNAVAPTAYRVVNTVTVTSDKVADVGQLIETAVKAGANQVQSVQFLVANPDTYRAQAVHEAVAAAAADGRALADAMGAKVVRIVELGTNDVPAIRGGLAMAPVAVGGAPPLFPGQTTVDANVDLALEVSGAALPAAATPVPTTASTATAHATVAATATMTPTLAATAHTTPTGAATLHATPTLRVAGTAAAPAAAAAHGKSIPFVAITQADTARYRGSRARAIVVTSQADWDRMIAPLLPANVKISPNYPNEAAVAIFLGERPGPGYAVKVHDIATENGLLTVHVDAQEPKSAVDRSAGPTSPFQIVTVKRSQLPATVKEPYEASITTDNG